MWEDGSRFFDLHCVTYYEIRNRGIFDYLKEKPTLKIYGNFQLTAWHRIMIEPSMEASK